MRRKSDSHSEHGIALLLVLFALVLVSAIGLAIGNFAAVVLPGMVFASGLSLAIPVFLNVTVFQILFIGYWFWANLMSPRFHIPTLTGTMLNATGPWAQEAFFHYQWTFLILNPSVVQGIESIALLVGVGLLAILLAWGYLVWHKA